MNERPVALELFAGIGGFSAAVGDHLRVIAALDLSSHTLESLKSNFPDVPVKQKNIQQLKVDEVRGYAADLWWMSPPCQPYTVRGKQADLDDPRARSLLHVLDLIEQVKPGAVAMENVRGFWDSDARQHVRAVLDLAGYEVCERIVCPTELGVPARRERYYMVASREGLVPPESMPRMEWPERVLRDYVDAMGDVNPELYVSEEDCEKFSHAMRIFDWEDDAASLNCFTSAYGKTFRYSGAFLRDATGRVRYFSPEELLRFLHFPETYRFPVQMSRRQQYKYVGNSVSVRAMREVLRALPILREVAG